MVINIYLFIYYYYFFCNLWVCWTVIFLVDFLQFVGLLNWYIFGWFFAVCGFVELVYFWLIFFAIGGFVELVYFWLIFCGLWVCWISIFLVDFFAVCGFVELVYFLFIYLFFFPVCGFVLAFVKLLWVLVVVWIMIVIVIFASILFLGCC